MKRQELRKKVFVATYTKEGLKFQIHLGPKFPLVCPCGELCPESKSLPPFAPGPSRKTEFESLERFA